MSQNYLLRIIALFILYKYVDIFNVGPLFLCALMWQHWEHQINSKERDLISTPHFHLNGGVCGSLKWALICLIYEKILVADLRSYNDQALKHLMVLYMIWCIRSQVEDAIRLFSLFIRRYGKILALYHRSYEDDLTTLIRILNFCLNPWLKMKVQLITCNL